VRLLINSNNIESIFCAPTRREADDVAKNFHRPGRTVQVWAADMFRVNSTRYVHTISSCDHITEVPGANRTGGLQSTVINSNSAMSLLSRDVASEIK
jgi:hypothetical protein